MSPGLRNTGRRRMTAVALLAVAAAFALAVSHAAGDASSDKAIRALLERSAAAWNAGDLEGYMAAYRKSEDLRFASGGSVQRGWQATLERYRRRYGDTPAAMGKLGFHDLEITRLAPKAAVVFGRYRLERQGEVSEGLFTLTVTRRDGEWRIIQDHTSTGD